MQIRVPKQRRIFASEWNCNSRRLIRSKACSRVLSAFSIVLILLISSAAAQETDQVSHDKDQEKTRENEKNPSASARLGRRPIDRRYAARYGQFVVQNSLVAGGNALLGYEPRYDFCRCDGFWPRTLHAVSRNFVAYNRTERELRLQAPTYAGAFVAGMLYDSWLPAQHNIWKGGAYSLLSQAAIGSGYNFVSEFALDILHSLGIKKDVKRSQ